jgi:hypothetical protein
VIVIITLRFLEIQADGSKRVIQPPINLSRSFVLEAESVEEATLAVVCGVKSYFQNKNMHLPDNVEMVAVLENEDDPSRN